MTIIPAAPGHLAPMAATLARDGAATLERRLFPAVEHRPATPPRRWPAHPCKRRPGAVRVLSHALVALLPFAAAQAAPPGLAISDAAACQSAIQAVERSGPVPPSLLSAIARTESGRALPGGRVVAWPWTINVAGTGHYFDTVQQAVAAVEAFRASGVQSIDVGCMQVNLMHHPGAFASLEQAFDPSANAGYAARFLTRLHLELGDWASAIGAYHSRTPGLADEYGRRVARAWPLAAAYGGARPADMVRTPATDPYGVYTPEFARRVAEAAAARAMRDGALQSRLGTRPQAGTLAQRFPSHLRVPRRGALVRLAQADEPASALRRP